MKQKKPLAKKSFKLSYRWTTWWQYSFSVSSKQYMYIFRLFFCFVCFCVWRTYIIYWQQLFKSKAPCITRIETVVSLFTTMDMVWLFSSTLPYYCHCSRNTRGWYIYIYIYVGMCGATNQARPRCLYAFAGLTTEVGWAIVEISVLEITFISQRTPRPHPKFESSGHRDTRLIMTNVCFRHTIWRLRFLWRIYWIIVWLQQQFAFIQYKSIFSIFRRYKFPTH